MGHFNFNVVLGQVCKSQSIVHCTIHVNACQNFFHLKFPGLIIHKSDDVWFILFNVFGNDA
jgi:hypothetical protein